MQRLHGCPAFGATAGSGANELQEEKALKHGYAHFTSIILPQVSLDCDDGRCTLPISPVWKHGCIALEDTARMAILDQHATLKSSTMCWSGKGSHLQRSSGTHALGVLEEQQLLTEVCCRLWARTGHDACSGALLCRGLCDCWVADDVHEPIQASLQGLLQGLNEFMSKNESRPREGA